MDTPTPTPASAPVAQAAPQERGTVEKVEDDLTLKIKVGKDTYTARLAGLVAPANKKSDAGKSAKKAVEKLLKGKDVDVERGDPARDKDGRALVYLWRGDELTNERLLRDGRLALDTAGTDGAHKERMTTAERQSKTHAVAQFLHDRHDGDRWLGDLHVDGDQAGTFGPFIEGDKADTIHFESTISGKDGLRAACDAAAEFIFAAEQKGLGLKKVKVHDAKHKDKVERGDAKKPCK